LLRAEKVLHEHLFVLELFVVLEKTPQLREPMKRQLLDVTVGPVLRIVEVDELLAQHRIDEALEATRNSDAPAAKIMYAGLDRHEEGTERVMKAIENQGLIELSKLEKGLVVLATLTNVAPLLGFLGTVWGMILAFQSIEAAGEVEATLVAGGIKVALLTTAMGLVIAIPVSIAHNYFVSRIDSLVIDMEESAQKMIDALHAMETQRAQAG